MVNRYLHLLIKPPEGMSTKMFREILNSAAAQEGKPMAELVRDAALTLDSVQTQTKIKLEDQAKSGEPK